MGHRRSSKEGRALCGALTAGHGDPASATPPSGVEMARELGPFPGHKKNSAHMLRVIRNHRRAAHGESRGYEALAVNPVPLDPAFLQAVRDRRAPADRLGPGAGARRVARNYRNAQTTVVALTGTIGPAVDCRFSGIEPDFSLVKLRSSPAAATGRSSATRGARDAARARLSRSDR